MKKLILIVACLGFATTGAFCQNVKSARTTPKATEEATTQYICPQCKAVTYKAGQCAKCKHTLVKPGEFYCPNCFNTAPIGSKCKKCHVDMVTMEIQG